jgi:DNA primase
LWHCFPCGEGGDGIRLVERVRGVTFAAAVLELAG